MEYASKTKANHLKQQCEKLVGAEGLPIVMLDCYPDVDVIAATGNYRGLTQDNKIAMTFADSASEQPIEQRSELLVGFNEIDTYVEAALEHYEQEGDAYAGVAAATLIANFPEHFPELPAAVIDSIAKSICGTEEYEDYLAALNAGDAMRARIDEIMAVYLKRFSDAREALRSARVTAYLEASTDPRDSDAQLGFLIKCRATKTQQVYTTAKH